VERSFRFVENERVSATADDGHGLLGGSDTCYADDASATGLGFLDEVGCTKLVFCEGVDVGDGFTAGALSMELALAFRKQNRTYLAYEFNLITLDILDRKDAQLGQEMQTQIIDSIA
jgi:hypothetical protein